MVYILFFFNDTATTEIYTLSLHDALPISRRASGRLHFHTRRKARDQRLARTSSARQFLGDRLRGLCEGNAAARARSEEHTSELQSRQYLVCRLLLEKK